MKIVQFDLIAFGPFTGQSLMLDGGNHGLHVVYGPNEAGKSSALRALRQFFFGIPHNSEDNFVHSHPDMRLGAKLRRAGGDFLECIRRKGKANTLRAADDVTVIEPAQLADFLGGLDESSFSLQFGIDNPTLQEGGRAIADGHGDVGAALFAAGSGIVDLKRVQQQLTEQSELLFKPRGNVQRISKALSELSRAKQELKASFLPTEKWERNDAALRAARERKEAIDATLRQKGAEKARLERVTKALPLIARRKTLLEEWAEVADAPSLSSDFAEARRSAIAEASAAESAEKESCKLLAEHQQALSGSAPPTALLEHATAIEQLFADLGAHRKATNDRPALEKQKQLLEDEARAILRDLDCPPDLEGAEKLRISRAERQRIQSLGSDGKAVEGQWFQSRHRVEQLKAEIARAQEELDAIGNPPETTALKQALQRVRQHGDLDGRLARSRAEAQQLREQAGIELQRLPLWTGTFEELQQVAVPALETVDRFDGELGELAVGVRGAHERIGEIGQTLRKLDQSLERQRLQQDVPTEDDLATVRHQRDEGWRLVRRAWEEGLADDPAIKAFVAGYPGKTDLATAYEASLAESDSVADRLRREAQQVAEKAKLLADRQELFERRNELSTQLEVHQENYAMAQKAWHQAWQPLGVEPLSPREMRSWLSRYGALIGLAEAIRKQEALVHELDQLVTRCRHDLSQALVEFGHPPAQPTERCDRLLQIGESQAEQLESRREARQGLLQDLGRLRPELKEAERLLSQAGEEREAWRLKWREVTQRLKLSDDAGSAEANRVLDAIDELFEKLARADDFRRRIDGINRDAKTYADRLRNLQELVSGDRSSLPIDQIVADFHDRLTAARRVQAEHNGLVQQVQREQAKLDKIRGELRHWRAAIATMCQEAHCQTAEQLPVAEQRSARRQRCEEERRQLEDRILEYAAGTGVEEFIHHSASLAVDELNPCIRQLASEIEQLEQERSALLQTIGSEMNERQRMDGSSQAAQAQEDAHVLLAQIMSDAEHYRRLRMASSILRTAIDRYRERHQGPLVQRASELFGELTLGYFEGLKADYNEDGKMVLVGVRPGGRQTVAVEAMSEGARDQLFLALRLASLEAYQSIHEPIPFVVDDILIKFDDDRSIAALKALARLSESTQVIFFTHHDHLVDLARQNLDHDVLFVHRLDCRSNPPVTSAMEMRG